MERIKKKKVKNISNEELFLFLENYLERTITEDLKHIYKQEAHLLDKEEPWVFRLKK